MPTDGSGPGGAWMNTEDDWPYLLAQCGPVIGWKVWYEDESTADSGGVKGWAQTPKTGVQVLVTYHKPWGVDGKIGRNSHTGKDEYTLPGEATTKLGLLISDALFATINADSKADAWRP